MAVVIINELVTEEDLQIAKEDYGDYIKWVADIGLGILAIGGEYHADAEEVLMKSGSKQSELWGGGLDLTTGELDFIALINIRPGINKNHTIQDQAVRDRVEKIVHARFPQSFSRPGPNK
jgi:hypothetical protein